jgi:hypothetical protein
VPLHDRLREAGPRLGGNEGLFGQHLYLPQAILNREETRPTYRRNLFVHRKNEAAQPSLITRSPTMPIKEEGDPVQPLKANYRGSHP